MESILFVFTALVTLVSALLVITRRNPITSVLFLVLTFVCLAVLYVMLGAQFIAALQVIVYAGAIMVLFLFVVMLLNLRTPQTWEVSGPLRTGLGFIVAGGVLLVAVTALKGGVRAAAALNPQMGTAAAVGDALFRRFLLPFEVASVLLLVAIVGVVAMVKQRPAQPKGEGGESK